MSYSNNKVVTIGPAEVRENLSAQEWEALVNVLDKLAYLGIELQIT